MTKLRDWLGIIAVAVGILTGVGSFLASQWNLSKTVKDLASVALDVKAWQDSVDRQAEIDRAVAAVLAERHPGNHRPPSQPEIIGKLAEAAPPPDTVEAKRLDLQHARLKRMAGRAPVRTGR